MLDAGGGDSFREVAIAFAMSDLRIIVGDSRERLAEMVTTKPMRFAYADPPYLGLAAKFYGHLHADAAAYDKLETHAALIDRLCSKYDGWAMSLHSPSLREILPLCPSDVRVMPWVKPFASFKPGVGVAYAWEPLIVRGGRKRTRQQHTVRDWHACNITLRRGFTGAKPEGVVEWLLQVLNVQPQDSFDDIFHGSGAVAQAVANYFSAPHLALSEQPEETTLDLR